MELRLVVKSTKFMRSPVVKISFKVNLKATRSIQFIEWTFNYTFGDIEGRKTAVPSEMD